jgi:hypothetical protein
MVDGRRQGDPREHFLAPGIGEVFLEVLMQMVETVIMPLR